MNASTKNKISVSGVLGLAVLFPVLFFYAGRSAENLPSSFVYLFFIVVPFLLFILVLFLAGTVVCVVLAARRNTRLAPASIGIGLLVAILCVLSLLAGLVYQPAPGPDPRTPEQIEAAKQRSRVSAAADAFASDAQRAFNKEDLSVINALYADSDAVLNNADRICVLNSLPYGSKRPFLQWRRFQELFNQSAEQAWLQEADPARRQAIASMAIDQIIEFGAIEQLPVWLARSRPMDEVIWQRDVEGRVSAPLRCITGPGDLHEPWPFRRIRDRVYPAKQDIVIQLARYGLKWPDEEVSIAKFLSSTPLNAELIEHMQKQGIDLSAMFAEEHYYPHRDGELPPRWSALYYTLQAAGKQPYFGDDSVVRSVELLLENGGYHEDSWIGLAKLQERIDHYYEGKRSVHARYLRQLEKRQVTSEEDKRHLAVKLGVYSGDLDELRREDMLRRIRTLLSDAKEAASRVLVNTDASGCSSDEHCL